jgi:hypothetical protein
MAFRFAATGLSLAALALIAALPGFARAAAPPAETPCPKGLSGAITCYIGADDRGAHYWIARPLSWNGTLIVHAHGGPRLGAPNPQSEKADLERFAVTVQEGYAWIASSYRRGGYGVRMAAEDSETARQIFVANFGQPRHTIVHGQSWGGNVAAKLIELYAVAPDGRRVYDGALLTSGVIAGGTLAYDFRADLRAVYQYYCHNHPRPDEEQYPLWLGLAADSKMTHADLAVRMKDCTGVGLPKDQRSTRQQQNLDNILNVIHIPERTLVSHMAWATFLFRDMVQLRLGGHNPFTNEGVQYKGSTDDAALNAGVVRFRADPQGVALLADDSDMTGQIGIPVVTMHAIDDPTAMVEMEAQYRSTVDKAGHGDLLVQTFTDEHVHSKLNDPEYPAVLDALMQWITAGKKPTPAGIAAACPAWQKVYGGQCLFRPDFHPAALDTRVYPRNH